MNRTLIATFIVVASFALASLPALTYLSANEAKAAETTSQKKKRVKTNYGQPAIGSQTRQKKRDYCGYAEEPNPAGMSDYCSFMYNIYCRRGVGCSIYGREY